MNTTISLHNVKTDSEYTLLFFLGSIHAGIFPSTMMNNFIVTQLDFFTTSTESYHAFHLYINDATKAAFEFKTLLLGFYS